METDRYKAIPRCYFAACQANDQAALEDVLAPDFVAHHAGLPGPLSRETLLHSIDAFSRAFSDQEYTILAQIAEGESVATRVTWRATHSGPFQGLPPTGKRVAVSGTSIAHIKDGKIVERWLEMDQMGLLQQLGLVP